MARKPPSPTAFTGFSPGAYGFLRGLEANNERAWFTEHKPDYEREVLTPMRLLVVSAAQALAAADIPLTGDPGRAIFRIHRDVRFSADKRPYKTNAGAVLTRDGAKGLSGMLYIHLAPSGDFLAAGFYMPEREALSALREAIYTQQARFLSILDGLEAAGFGLSEMESLSRLPRGFEEAGEPRIVAALKQKSYLIRRPLPEGRMGSAAVLDDIVDFARHALPLLEFGWAALTVLDPAALTRDMARSRPAKRK